MCPPARVSAVIYCDADRMLRDPARWETASCLICHLWRGEDAPSCSSQCPSDAWPRCVSGATWRTWLRRKEPFLWQVRQAGTATATRVPHPPAWTQRPAIHTHRGGRAWAGGHQVRQPRLRRSHGSKQPVSVYLIEANAVMASNGGVIYLFRA